MMRVRLANLSYESQGNLGRNCMQKDTCQNSERDALLFDPESNELNDKKMIIFIPKEVYWFGQFLLFTNCWA